MEGPLLAVVIMVKNEEEAMERTLLPFVEAGVTHMCVFDTGSTDSTLEVTKSFFKKYNVTGFLNQEPFVDFATSRNRALELAEGHIPNANFFIMVDADWYIENAKRLLEFCESEKNKKDVVYNIRVMLDNWDYTSTRLFRADAKVRYEGVVHEVPEIRAKMRVYDDVYFKHTLTRVNLRQSKARYLKDLELLFESYEKNPTNARTLFYIAQTYECLDDLKNAYKYYLKRSRIQGWYEEDYVTLYRLGYIAETLSKVEDDITWFTAMDYFMKAFALRPIRIEALVKIAFHYMRENPQIAFVYAQYACSTPYPQEDMLFIPQEIYNFTRFDILSVCAWYMGEFEIGKRATEMALKAKPNDEMLKQKLSLYEAQISRVKLPHAAIIYQDVHQTNSLST